MRNLSVYLFLMLFFISCTENKKALPVDRQVDSLLSIMTVNEKIGQLCCPIGIDKYHNEHDSIYLSEDLKKLIKDHNIGSLYAVMRACPWSQKTLETGLDIEESIQLLNDIQRYNIENTRLKIPLLFVEECAHGHMAIEGTVFPTGIAQASSWNEQLLEMMGVAISEEASMRGAHIAYGPVLDIARDPRWSRVEEGFGEDPYLSATLGTAVTKGIQTNMAATLKHFAAYGIPEGGHNGAAANVGRHKLLTDYLPAFRKGIENGARCVMTSYNCIDGIPCTSNKWLLQDILRDRWEFDGLVFSDLFSISALHGTHKIAETPKHAAALALDAGVDIDLGNGNYGKYLEEAINEGLVTMEQLDNAVRRVLELKFEMGLFDKPYINNEGKTDKENNSKIALQVAREGTVLLKNNGILPLDDNIRSIAVIGPNADNMYNQLGDYTTPQHPDNVTTILEGIKERASGNISIKYVKGCDIRDRNNTDIESAVKIASESDVVIVAVGGSSARSFKDDYESADTDSERLEDMDCGEGYDRYSIELSGDQELLIKELAKTNKPMIIIYVMGRPMLMNTANEHTDALLCAWYPGQEGGHAIADILFGDYNPSGKLPISIPANIGQIPVYYSLGEQHDYVEGSSRPLFEFGYGLSYTKFLYENMRVSVENDIIDIHLNITNTGDYDGNEIVQLYVRDKYASVAPPDKTLKDFEKISLKAKEKKEICFTLHKDELLTLDENLEWIFEGGEFDIMIGASSDDIRLEKTIIFE